MPGGSDSTENAGSAAVAVHRRGVVPLELAAASSSSFQCAILGVVFALFKGIFRTPSIWTLSPGFQRTFWGALDDEEFFVIEGSGVAGTPGV